MIMTTDSVGPRPQRHIYVVLPAYNEEGNLKTLLERIDFSMREDFLDFSIIVVDDGSSDRTLQIAQECARTIPIKTEKHEVNRGLGETIRDGLKIAASSCQENDIVVVMDADNTHSPGLIIGMVRSIREGCDVVIASRYTPHSYIRGLSGYRKALSYAASILFRVLFPIRGVKDYTSGFRAYRGGVLKEAFERYGNTFVSEGGFQCMVDILLKLHRMDVIFREVPLILRYDRKDGASKMKVLRTIFKTLSLAMRRRLGFT